MLSVGIALALTSVAIMHQYLYASVFAGELSAWRDLAKVTPDIGRLPAPAMTVEQWINRPDYGFDVPTGKQRVAP